MPPPHQPFAPRVHYQVANWIASLRQLGLSKEESLEVLSKDDFPNGQFERQGKNYANIPGEDLRKLGKAFRLAVGREVSYGGEYPFRREGGYGIRIRRSD